ncbi:MAG TPA: bacitracin ABC transporter ATP-binding protein [Bacillus sp. (in: firmicutes)]|nr:bacitracin ABC transporter ATP-binding protein [Bacillus sp. (in: firmicutes)]
MSKENNPLLSDEFLDEVVKEINQLYGGPAKDENDVPTDDDIK